MPADPRDGWIAPHGHNLLLNTLAEGGLVGGIALAWILVAVALSLWRAWRAPPGSKRSQSEGQAALLVGVCAALAGYLVHYQFDVLAWLPASSLVAIMLCALGMQAAGKLEPGSPLRRRWTAVGLVASLVLVLVLARADTANEALARGALEANEGDWTAAARSLDVAATVDPSFLLYHEQRGYAYGVLATLRTGVIDPGALTQALDSYSVALRAGPAWTPSLLNASQLKELAGDKTGTISLLEKGATLEGAGPLAALLLANRYVAQGEETKALALYRETLTRYDWARDLAACRGRPVCRAVSLLVQVPSDLIRVAHADARAFLSMEQPQQALDALASVPLQSSAPLPWIDRADAHLALGQIREAAYALRVAQELRAPDESPTAVHFAMSSASLSLARGDIEEATHTLESVARPELILLSYHQVLYRRLGLPGLLIPPLDLLQRTEDDLAAYRRLAELYRSQGRAADAAWSEQQAAALAALLARRRRAMKAQRILHVVGARPNFMKVAPIMNEMARYPEEFQQILVHTGQHYDANMSKLFFEELGLPEPDMNLEVGSGTHGWQTAQVMMRLEAILLDQKPDWVIVPGDVNSTLAAALAASKLRIRVAHVEAGLRSFDRTMPEEINRVLTDHLADLLFTTEPSANENLRREGIPDDSIRFVGNVMIDSLVRLLPQAEARFPQVCNRLGLFGPYVLVTLHRPSNVDDAETLHEILSALAEIAREMHVVFPVHPRTRQRIDGGSLSRMSLGAPDIGSGGLRLIDPLGYLDFLALEARAGLVLTDSGGIQEETTYLGVPCLTARPNTERPITLTSGTNRLVESDRASLINAYRDAIRLQGAVYSGIRRRPELWDGCAAERIAAVFRGMSQ